MRTSKDSMSLRFELFVEDIKRSVNFYKDILGFVDGFVSADGGYHSVKRGDVTIGLGEVEGLGANHHFLPEIEQGRKGLGVEIVLEVDDVNKAYEEVKSSGHRDIEALINRSWGLTDFRVIDPDGYYLRITNRF